MGRKGSGVFSLAKLETYFPEFSSLYDLHWGCPQLKFVGEIDSRSQSGVFLA